jgi:hypothetical protein
MTWDEIAAVASKGGDEDVRTLVCPRCGGATRLSFSPGHFSPFGGVSAGSLWVGCDRCMERIVLDGVPNVPPWVERLGNCFPAVHPG